MDNTSDTNLFKADQNKVVLPHLKETDEQKQQALISKNIAEAYLGDTVQKLILPKTSVIAEENFIFDFSETESITIFQREAVKSLIDPENGNVTLYLYGKSGLVEFGKGEKYSLERMVPLVRHYIFGDSISIYKNYVPGSPAVSIVSQDITKMRLHL